MGAVYDCGSVLETKAVPAEVRTRLAALPVALIKDFLELFRSCLRERQQTILSNLHTKFDALKRYEGPKPRTDRRRGQTEGEDHDFEDIPF